jgi:hypothetical protein
MKPPIEDSAGMARILDGGGLMVFGEVNPHLLRRIEATCKRKVPQIVTLLGSPLNAAMIDLIHFSAAI